MLLSEINPELRPENLPPQDVLRNFHNALRLRYYYLAFSLAAGPFLLPIVGACEKMLSKILNNKNHNLATAIYLFFYVNVLGATIALFNFGARNRFDPLYNECIPVIETRLALRVLVNKVRAIYEDDIFKLIRESPRYTNPDQKLETSLLLIDDAVSYTPFKLAKEIGANNILDFFEKAQSEMRVIKIVFSAYVKGNTDLKCLDRDSILRIFSYVAGASLVNLKDKAPAADSRTISDFIIATARKRRAYLPKLLTYYETALDKEQKEQKEQKEHKKQHYAPSNSHTT